MKKFLKVVFIALITLVLLGVISWGVMKWYDTSDLLQNTFGSSNSTQSGIRVPTDDPNQVESMLPSLGGKISLLIFILILFMQFFSLGMIAVIVKRIVGMKDATLEQKEEAFKNADIFLDLPLYIGLFGSVASFVLISFSPQSSRLIAYSSTLIGIIFSVCAKIGFVYPVKNRLLIDEIKKNR